MRTAAISLYQIRRYTVGGTESSRRKPVYDVLLGGTVAANTGGDEERNEDGRKN